MCPWNSQNTLFERDALWGLLIPVTTTFRVCDIWRSYWVQVRRGAPLLPHLGRRGGCGAPRLRMRHTSFGPLLGCRQVVACAPTQAKVELFQLQGGGGG